MQRPPAPPSVSADVAERRDVDDEASETNLLMAEAHRVGSHDEDEVISMEDAIRQAAVEEKKHGKRTTPDTHVLEDSANGATIAFKPPSTAANDTAKRTKQELLRFFVSSPWHETNLVAERQAKLVALRPKHKSKEPIKLEKMVSNKRDEKYHFRSRTPISDEAWSKLCEYASAIDKAKPDPMKTSEIWCMIGEYLGTMDLLAASETCRCWFVFSHQARDDRMHLPVYHPMHLNEEQRRIYRAVVYERKNQFFTGNAGTGKSFLLRALMAGCESQFRSVQAVAATGLAAIQVGGLTVHQFLGISMKPMKLSKYIERQRTNSAVCLLAQITDVLFVDEVFMMTRGLFEAADKIMRAYLNVFDKPFGGVQVVCAGDPYQLRAIPEKESFFEAGSPPVVGFPFETDGWRELFGEPVRGKPHNLSVLTVPLRQARDKNFRTLLDTVREGRAAFREEQFLLSRTEASIIRRGQKIPDCISLFPRNPQVEEANKAALKKLVNVPSFDYKALDTVVHGNREVASKMLKECRTPAEIHLREGCRVMLLRNYLDMRLCHGSQGYVRRLMKLSDPKQARELRQMLEERNCGIIGDERFFIEWNEQKNCFDLRLFGKQRMFGSGTASKLDSLPLVEFDQQPGRMWMVMPMSHEFYVREPVVSDTNKKKLIFRDVLVATREQLPLILGYAFSIHKAQGMTLERARLDLYECWEIGQVYSSLSRLRSADGLYIRTPPDWMKLRQKPIDPKIIAYDRQLRQNCTVAAVVKK